MNSKKDYIYNFFKFLEEKEGKSLRPDKKFAFKVKYEPETLTKEDFKESSFSDLDYVQKLGKYRPDLVTLEDVDLVGNTKGNKLKLKLKYFPSKITPEDLKPGELWLVDPEITYLPKGITTKRVDINRDSGLEKLPENLTCNTLRIEGGTKIQSLPKDLKVTKSIKLPYSFKGEIPKHLRSITEFPYGVTEELRNLFKDVKDFTFKIGNRNITTQGIEVEPAQVKNLLVGTTSENTKLISLISKGPELRVEWDKVLIQASTGGKHHIPWYILGKDKKGRKLMWTSEDTVITAEAKVSVRSFNIRDFSQAIWDKMQSKLFPKSEESTPKAIGIRKLFATQGKPVGWKIGRKIRGGEVGISGQAKDLIYSLSTPSQNNLLELAEHYKVEWGDMIIFENRDSINFITRSKKPYKGSEYLYLDKGGYGQGGYTRVFVGPNYTKI